MGFFHADPHPGNLVATNSGALVYFDFGMMGEIPRHYRVGLIQVVRAVELFLTQGTRSNYCQAKDVLQKEFLNMHIWHFVSVRVCLLQMISFLEMRT